MLNTPTKGDRSDSVNQGSKDDDLYERSAFQFTADRLGTLVRIAERDPKHQVLVPVDTMNKIYLAYLGALEIAQEQTAVCLQINGKSFLCTQALQNAMAPLIEEHYRSMGEKEVQRDMAAMRKEAEEKAFFESRKTATAKPL